MFSKIISVCILLIPIMGTSQSYHIVKLDSTRWRIEQRVIQKGGSGSVTFSDIADSATTIQRYSALVEQKKAALDQKFYEREYEAMNGELFRASGKKYEDMLRDMVERLLIGNWQIASGKDTLAVSVNPKMEVRGGQIRGELKYHSPDSIALVGVLAKTHTLKFTPPGKLEGNEVVMKKE